MIFQWEVEDSLVSCEELQMAFSVHFIEDYKRHAAAGFCCPYCIMQNGHQKELGKLLPVSEPLICRLSHTTESPPVCEVQMCSLWGGW